MLPRDRTRSRYFKRNLMAGGGAKGQTDGHRSRRGLHFAASWRETVLMRPHHERLLTQSTLIGQGEESVAARARLQLVGCVLRWRRVVRRADRRREQNGVIRRGKAIWLTLWQKRRLRVQPWVVPSEAALKEESVHGGAVSDVWTPIFQR
jgi:hypothetical protein